MPDMDERTTVIVLAMPEEQVRSTMTEGLRRRFADAEVHACGTSDEVLEAAETYHPDVVILTASLGPVDGFTVVGEVQNRVPTTGTLLLAENVRPEDFRRALRAGARDLLQLPLEEEEFYQAVNHAIEVSRSNQSAWETMARQHVADEEHIAKRIVVFSTKGGTGKTFISANLACGLAQTGKQVALLDLDLQFGDSAIAMGLVPERTLYDLVRTYDEFDIELMKGFMIAHPSGVQVLPAPLYPDQAEEITSEDIRAILEVIQTGYDYVIVDSPPFFEDRIIAALDWADTILHVGSLDLLTVKNMKLGSAMMNLMSYEEEKVRVVMNRADSRVGLALEDAEKHLGLPITHTIPSSIDVPRALNAGEIILQTNPSSRVAQELDGIVRTFLNANGNGNGNGKKRGFKLFGKK